MNILDWVEFGKVSAERDDNLSSYFFDNGVLTSAIESPTAFLVLGRKGAGKTALFKYLDENREDFLSAEDLLLPQSFEDYNWNIHSILADETKAASMVYKQSWKFVIYAETIQALLQYYERSGQAAPTRIRNAGRMLEKLFDTPTPSIYQVVGRKMLELSKLRLPSAGLDLESGDLNGISADAGEVSFESVKTDATLRQRLTENVNNITRTLEAALESTDGWPRTFICFDRVDEAWDDASVDSSRPVIGGLVAAADAINAQFHGRLRPLIFLREDIFETLSINDANKLREDCGALLHWNKTSLNAMILKRVNFYGEQHGVDPVTDLDAMFDKAEMRQRAKPFNYILRRTMMRPRDLISILSRTVDAMREKANDPFKDDVLAFDDLECDSIYAAEPGYSEWLKQELLDEWGVQRPIIRKLLQALQSNGSTNVTRETLTNSLRALDPEIPVTCPPISGPV
ncbi:P-loop ATPase, Sll1717 family [Luteimonas lutimaris]|uniref:ATPase n=1 Tax=Luteimonas lutimaris TaxID=698645 RepID=A0ABP7N1C9_9GAMM